MGDTIEEMKSVLKEYDLKSIQVIIFVRKAYDALKIYYEK